MWRSFVPISGTLWVPESCAGAPGLACRLGGWWRALRDGEVQTPAAGLERDACVLHRVFSWKPKGWDPWVSFLFLLVYWEPCSCSQLPGKRQETAGGSLAADGERQALASSRSRRLDNPCAGGTATWASSSRQRLMEKARGGPSLVGGGPAAAAGEVKVGAAGEVGSPGVSPSPSLPPSLPEAREHYCSPIIFPSLTHLILFLARKGDKTHWEPEYIFQLTHVFTEGECLGELSSVSDLKLLSAAAGAFLLSSTLGVAAHSIIFLGRCESSPGTVRDLEKIPISFLSLGGKILCTHKRPRTVSNTGKIQQDSMFVNLDCPGRI